MWTLFGLLVVLTVSGSQCKEAEVNANITGDFGGSVRLPCPRSDINVDKEVSWQMESPTQMLVLSYMGENYYNRYTGRTEMFLKANNRNCSLLLKNITTEDQGIYRCNFHIGQRYNWSLVQLNIIANYNICLEETSANVFQCDASGRYGDAEIQWSLDGQLLQNSPPTNITWNATTGDYHFTSIIQASSAAKYTCAIKARNLPTRSYECRPSPSGREGEPGSSAYGFLILIPIMAVFGFGLIFLWHRRRFPRRLPKTREAETDNLYC